MLLFFLNRPYREDSAEAQYLGSFETLDSPSLLDTLKAFILEAFPVYSYGWMDVFDTSSHTWYSGCLNFDHRYEEDSACYTVNLTSFKPRDDSVAFFRNFTFHQGTQRMNTGTAQELLADAAKRMENVNALASTALQAAIRVQKSNEELAKSIDALMAAQKDIVYLQTLMSQFDNVIGSLGVEMARSPVPSNDASAPLPPLNTQVDERLPAGRRAFDTASAALGQNPEPPAPLPGTEPRRRLAASPALKNLSEAAGSMVKELLHHREELRKEQAPAPARRGPTPDDSAMAQRLHPGATEDTSQYIGHFSGPSSLFVRFMSPEVTTGGRGFAAPGYAGLRIFKDDVSQISPEVILAEDWETGFYRNSKSGTRQFFMRLPSALVLLDNPLLPNNFPVIGMNNRATGKVEWRHIRQLTVPELSVIHDQIIDEFQRLEELDKQQPQARA